MFMHPIVEETRILTIANPADAVLLKAKTRNFPFDAFPKTKLQELLGTMRRIMKRASGIGLSANQIGLPYRLFVAEVSDREGKPKFYAIFNPSIAKIASETGQFEEGCLSIPGQYGTVERFKQVTLIGVDKRQQPIKIRAWGTLAHVFQHEVDHLDGKLFIEKATEIHEQPASERLKEHERKVTSSK